MIIVDGTPLKHALSFKELAPGSFCIDSERALAFVWPREGTRMHEAVLGTAVRPTLLEVVGRTNFLLRGITFVNANSCVPYAADLPPGKWKQFIATLSSDRNRWVNSANKTFFQPPAMSPPTWLVSAPQRVRMRVPPQPLPHLMLLLAVLYQH